MKRQDISKLEKNRAIHLKLGFIAALGLMLMAFNWTVSSHEVPDLDLAPIEKIDEIPVVRTAQEEPRFLPPPAPKPSERFDNINTPDFSEFPLPTKIDPSFVATEPALPGPPIMEPKPVPPPPPILEEEEDDAPPIFKFVEEMPLFGKCTDKGMSKEERKVCSDKAILQYVYDHIRYPSIARQNQIEGTVVASFVVEKDGTISQLEITRDIGGGCGKEVFRVIENMPDWSSPGLQRGRPVRVMMNLPVKFRLE